MRREKQTAAEKNGLEPAVLELVFETLAAVAAKSIINSAINEVNQTGDFLPGESNCDPAGGFLPGESNHDPAG